MPLWCLITLSITAAVLELLCIARGLWYIKASFPKRRRPGFRRYHERTGAPVPKVSLFVPCKGMSPDFEGNIRAMLRQDYPDYELICITESERDPAAPLLAGMARTEARLHHVVAGQATRCCQKNHNLLKGIDHAVRAHLKGEIYVFADMDIRPDHDWLSHITLPLADERVFAVSGFRSLIPGSDRFAEHLHAAFSALQAMAMTETAYAAMWGGSMALRRRDFETYRVPDKWSTAMVDDMSLTWIIRKHHLTRVFSPDCLVTSRETYPELRRVMKWIVRQTQYAAIYLRAFTAFGLCLNSTLAVSMILCPVLLVFTGLGTVSHWVAVLSLAIYILTATGISLLGVFVRQKGIACRWFLYAPCFLLIGCLCGWVGFFSRRLCWADILYQFNRSGEVLSVEQLALFNKTLT
jgi:ceramide glucosyltransferase